MATKLVSWETLNLVDESAKYYPPGADKKTEWIEIIHKNNDSISVQGSQKGKITLKEGDFLTFDRGSIYEPFIFPRLGKYPKIGMVLVEAGIPISIFKIHNHPVFVPSDHQEWVLGNFNWEMSQTLDGDCLIKDGGIVVVGKVILGGNFRRYQGYVYHSDIVIRENVNLSYAALVLRKFLFNL